MRGAAMKTEVTIAAVALTVGVALGYYALPTRVITETKIVEVEKKTEVTERDKHKKTVTKEVVKPDGSKETTTTTEEDTKTNKKERTSDTTSTEARKEVVYEKGSVNISALAGASSVSGPIIYGAAVTKRVLGPFTAGAWVLTSPTVGVSLGLTF